MKRIMIAVAIVCAGLWSGVTWANGFESISVGGGLAKPEAIDTTYYFTAGARFLLNDSWAVEPVFGYWNQDEASQLCLARGCVIFGLRDASIGGNILYLQSVSAVQFYAGGGLAAHFRKQSVTRDVVPSENHAEPTSTRLGLQLEFGADIPIAKAVDFTVAIRDDFIFREDPEGTQGVFQLYGGIRFNFD